MTNREEAGNQRPGRHDRFRRNPRVAQQVLGGRAVVLHYEGRRVLGLNRTGTLVWSRLDGSRTIDEIAAETARAENVPATTAADDVTDFIAQLWARELVERSD